MVTPERKITIERVFFPFSFRLLIKKYNKLEQTTTMAVPGMKKASILLGVFRIAETT